MFYLDVNVIQSLVKYVSYPLCNLRYSEIVYYLRVSLLTTFIRLCDGKSDEWEKFQAGRTLLVSRQMLVVTTLFLDKVQEWPSMVSNIYEPLELDALKTHLKFHF